MSDTTAPDTERSESDDTTPPTDGQSRVLVDGFMMTADEWGKHIVASESADDNSQQVLPVMSWYLSATTPEMAHKIEAALARVHAETDAVIAAEESEVHETCPTCNHVKTFVKVVNTKGVTDLVPKGKEPATAKPRGYQLSARRPLGFKPAKKGSKKA
ncbi:hypothetical protein T484DRAFT_1757882 [Baffinella frigidus]|nr:hypothetical protein T484DRAFT_1757882 [Cryptophyta sp. CCMP2293]